jgi:hypothetical protein
MKIHIHDSPRRFSVGKDGWVTISDCARVMPEEGEMVTIAHADGLMRWPVVRRRWGFSLPLALDRPTERGLKAVLSGKDDKRCHLLFFDPSRSASFLSYEKAEDHRRFTDLTE